MLRRWRRVVVVLVVGGEEVEDAVGAEVGEVVLEEGGML